ncbi:MAG: glycosyltransferase family 2 protein [Prevotella sp.]|nr:glycosyltransferase family 2 protein [Prevotella sp.]
MKEIKVTICVPVYGVEQFIERCARSLFEQTYDALDYVFVDDCSKDRSIEVLQQVVEAYPQRKPFVKIVSHERNRGLAVARRTAVEHATGDYILQVDSDDYLSLDAVSLLVQQAEATGADIVAGSQHIITATQTVYRRDLVPQDKDAYARSLLIRKSIQGVVGKLFRRSLIMEHQLFPPEGLNMAEDYVVMPRIAYYAHRVAKVDAPIYNYVKYNPDSYTTSISRRGIDCTIEALSVLETFFRQVGNASFYAEAINLAKLYNKVTLYTLAAQTDYAYVRPLYPEVKVWRTSIELKHKLLLTMASMGLDSLVYRIIHLFR